jgi:hypothetical protein
VRRAGGKGFAPPISRAYPQDGDEDVEVRDYSGQATDNQYSSSYNKN